MAAGLGFKTFTSGEVLTAADTNGYLMQGINVFANASARTAAITSPQEGQYSYLKDTNALEYYDGAAWVGAPVGDITAVTAGTGISGGGSSGDVTITNSMATTIDAKGDLIAGTADNAFARLAVGSNGETIVADSSTSTGLRYQAPAAPQPVLNSAFQVWQRGTSIAGQQAYTADRWYKLRGSDSTGQTVSRQTTSDTTNLPNIQYCARVQRVVSNTSVDALFFYQPFETVNSIPFAGKTVTMSFYARAGANYSSASSALTATLYTGTGTDQQTSYAYTGSATPINATATLTTTWQRFSYTGTIASTATEMGPTFIYTPVGTAGANDYFEITGVQIEVGSVATQFKTFSATLQGELAACQRYYYRATSGNTYRSFASAFSNATTNMLGLVPFPVTMRTAPTALEQSGTASDYGIQQGATGITCSAVPALSNATTYNSLVQYTVASGLTIGQAGLLRNENNATAYLAWSAEL